MGLKVVDIKVTLEMSDFCKIEGKRVLHQSRA